MIDLHSHIVPGVDDGARDMAMALEMARLAIADGTRVIAATPHVTPGLYDNDAWSIDAGISRLRAALEEAGLELSVVMGGDIHVAPDMGDRLLEGVWPRLAGSRYFLFEPPHHVLPPGLDHLARSLLDVGLVPVLTHPERLTWIENHYDVVCRIEEMGCAIQITAGAITGRFGKRARYWADRLLAEGRVDLLASDAHNTTSRPPVMSPARDVIAKRYDDAFARRLVHDAPAAILRNQDLPQKNHETGAYSRTREQERARSPRRGHNLGRRLADWLSGAKNEERDDEARVSVT